MGSGAKRKYDPQPGETFFGQTILGPSARQGAAEDGERWMLVACPKCGRPRDVNIYRIAYGYATQCLDCARAGAQKRAAAARRKRAA